jgi:hypothetical protein
MADRTQYWRNYYAAHRDRVRARQKLYYAAHKKESAAATRSYRQRNAMAIKLRKALDVTTAEARALLSMDQP